MKESFLCVLCASVVQLKCLGSISSTEPPIEVVEINGQLDQPIVILQIIKESLRQAGVAVVGARERAGNGGHGVGVVAGIHGREKGLLEVFRGGKEAPGCTREGFQNVGAVVPGVKGGPSILKIAGKLGTDPHMQ
jgi:hypothetical protein